MAGFSSASTGSIPVASGIQLVPTSTLPDRLKPVFPYPFFNAIQSQCFKSIYNTSDNFVLSAPTGSGKTVILELAICRFVASSANTGHRFKTVYQAPTKALCSERCRDWKQKFSHLNLTCEELTGDTEQTEVTKVQKADIIVTTPEKWDRVTRKWKDQRKLMELVKLFLIDEVHILKEDRGATLEAVVSRMRTVGKDIRFVALSATIPNSEDIATWLGRNSQGMHLSAVREVFGEEFRPVRLEKHIIGLQSSGNNDWIFDKTCGNRLPDIIVKHSKAKPIMVFCVTRKVAQATALDLAKWWLGMRSSDRCWDAPRKQLNAKDKDLAYCMQAGVAFHHAGISASERRVVEEGYIAGDLNVICCTATLAVGVNLPCHLVIIKNTVFYQTESASCVEYSDLDMMQMLGRAGRPQFDKSAIAVILTRQEKVQRYESMVQGRELLESRLHLNLIEHLNSEIGLGTIFDLDSARQWLESTFLFVRLAQNPGHYKIVGDTPVEDLTVRAERICQQGLASLQQCDLVRGGSRLYSTGLGNAMSRYSVTITSMKLLLGLQGGARMSEILSAVAQASELQGVRFKAGEKPMYKEVNSSNMIRFPIKVNLNLPGHKVSLVIQSALAGMDPSAEKRFQNLSHQYATDKQLVLQLARRILRCLIDCQVHLEDAVSARAGMELARSLAAEAWDDLPCQLAQIEQIGPVAVRRLAGAHIKTIEDLENCEPRKIEMILSRNPPFGSTILKNLRHFPRVIVTMKAVGQPMRLSQEGVSIKVQVELGVLNDPVPTTFNRIAVHICFLAEASDGRLLHFCRTSASRLKTNSMVSFTATLHDRREVITGYVSCDDIAGTSTYASLEPNIPASMFSYTAETSSLRKVTALPDKTQPHATRGPRTSNEFDDYGEDIADDDLIGTVGEESAHKIDDSSSDSVEPLPPPRPLLAGKGKARQTTSSVTNEVTSAQSVASGFTPAAASNQKTVKASMNSNSDWQPERLSNGNWKCGHKCKDRRVCKHLCCRSGLESKPKAPKPKKSEEIQESTTMQAFKQRKLQSASKRTTSAQHVHDEETNNASTGTKNKRSKTSPKLHDDDEDVFDDIDRYPSRSGTPPSQPRVPKCIPGEKGHSLFLNDTSSPEKMTGDDGHGPVGKHSSSDVRGFEDLKTLITPIKSINKRGASPARPVSKRQRLATFEALELAVVNPISRSGEQASTIERTASWPTHSWSQEAEDLFGADQIKEHGAGRISEITAEYDRVSNATIIDDEEDFHVDLGSDDLRHLGDEIGGIPEIPRQSLSPRWEEGDSGKNLIHASQETESNVLSGLSRLGQDEIDAFTMREFGDYVNFV